MFYADGPTTHCDTYVAATPARVWELVTDVALPARFSPELQRIEWLDGATGPEPGARFAGYNRHPALGDWRTISQVIEMEPQRAFGWVVMDADDRFGGGAIIPDAPMAVWRFDLHPAAGGTRLRQSVRIGPARSGVSLAIDRMPDQEESIVEGRIGELRTGMEATLDGIKTLAEQHP